MTLQANFVLNNPAHMQKSYATNPAILVGLKKRSNNWFAHHGDELYEELKHLRNHLHSIEALLQGCTSQRAEDIVTPMAKAHAILMSQCQRKHGKKDTRQLELF